MESISLWQGLALCGIVSWIVISSSLNVTRKLRTLVQPWVSHHVITGTPMILQIQKYQHGFLDALFSGLSCVVSVPFYTAFLPLLFWSGHGKLARQMTLLMSLCDYSGNCIKDVVSAPRPRCPPVRRIIATKDEQENALEYGLPSSHTLNTVCLSGYLLHYVLSYTQSEDASLKFAGFAVACLIVCLTGLGRIYLGMHSVIDIIAGLAVGFVILAFWLSVHNHVDSFIVSGQNVTTFWAALSLLLLFAYPTPELPTPSFEFHTAFDGVAFGIVAGVQQTYHQFHHESVPRIFTPQLTVSAFLGRMLVGIPTILIVKYCSKALAKWILPIVSNTLGIPIRSTSYIPMLKGSVTGKKTGEIKQSGYIKKLPVFSSQGSFDVDTGIRFLQYSGLAWSVVDLVPSLFSYLML
uniref:Phosphatidic acid phosphatase type 2/haloperoxidase domain-containing protein n=1 Tax=Salix viminalis TaxID=40686 RepID=A0A6N2N3S8_SALVM